MDHEPTVALLLENKANPKTQSDDGKSPLSVACKKDNLAICRLLLDKDAMIDAEAYYAACCLENAGVLQLLRSKGGQPASRNVDGSIALHCSWLGWLRQTGRGRCRV